MSRPVSVGVVGLSLGSAAEHARTLEESLPEGLEVKCHLQAPTHLGRTRGPIFDCFYDPEHVLEWALYLQFAHRPPSGSPTVEFRTELDETFDLIGATKKAIDRGEWFR